MAIIERHDSPPNGLTTVIGYALDGTLISLVVAIGDEALIGDAIAAVARKVAAHDAWIGEAWETKVRSAMAELTETHSVVAVACERRTRVQVRGSVTKAIEGWTILDGTPEDDHRLDMVRRRVALDVLAARVALLGQRRSESTMR